MIYKKTPKDSTFFDVFFILFSNLCLFPLRVKKTAYCRRLRRFFDNQTEKKIVGTGAN